MKSLVTISTAFIFSVLLATPSYADGHRHHKKSHRHHYHDRHCDHRDYHHNHRSTHRHSSVTRVYIEEPVYTREVVYVERPVYTREVVYVEQPTRYVRHHGHSDGLVAGGLIGAAIGHELGRSSESAIVGGILGAAIGHELGRR
jgi:Glycine zipper 2TM domain